MPEFLSDLLLVVGLALTGVGAWIASKSVILSEDDALKIGLPRYASQDRLENLNMPHVQNLLSGSRSARTGLLLIVAGTALQVISPLVSIVLIVIHRL
jgi:hypothetical protein